MSGHLFSGVSPVSLREWKFISGPLMNELWDAGVDEITPVGSTGLKDPMGDIDLAVHHPQGRQVLQKVLQRRFDVVIKGNDLLSFKYPLTEARWAQVDLMVGNPAFISWARVGTTEPGLKGADRALLLNTILSWKNRQVEETLDRTRLALDFGEGLFRINQTRRGRNSNILKNWKTVERVMLTDVPSKIASFFGEDVTADELRTVLGAVIAVVRSEPALSRVILDDWAAQQAALAAKHPGSYGDPTAVQQLVKRAF